MSEFTTLIQVPTETCHLFTLDDGTVQSITVKPGEHPENAIFMLLLNRVHELQKKVKELERSIPLL